MASECSFRVRTYECDMYGHVNNANYLNYLEHARFEYLRDIGFDFLQATKAGYGIFIARIEIDYKAPATTDDFLAVKTWPIKKGTISGVIAQEIRRGDDLITKAKVTWAFVDAKTGVPTKIPKKWDLSGLYPEEQ
jgi:acyl-CoA thioester hydrolase